MYYVEVQIWSHLAKVKVCAGLGSFLKGFRGTSVSLPFAVSRGPSQPHSQWVASSHFSLTSAPSKDPCDAIGPTWMISVRVRNLILQWQSAFAT